MDLVPRLRKYDAELEVLWERPGSQLAGRVLTRRIALDTAGYLYAGGWYESGSASQQELSWIARYYPDGSLDWEKTLPQGWRVEDVLPTNDAIYAITVGPSEITALKYAAQLHRMTVDGVELWKTTLENVHLSLGMPIRLKPTADGGVIFAYSEPDEQTSPDQNTAEHGPVVSLARFDAKGALIMQRRLSPPLQTSELGKMVQLPDGRYLVVGTQWPTFEPLLRYPIQTWVVDEDGEIFAQSVISTHEKDYFRVQAATESPDGGAIVSGYLTYYTGMSSWKPIMVTDFANWQSDAFMLKVDRWGGFEWMRLFGGPRLDLGWDIVVSLGGSFNLIGVSSYNLESDLANDAKSLLIRTDFWGRTCGMRLGVCADKKWQDCEDGNPCTINWCDPDQGCTHPARPDGSMCDIGKTCQGGECE